MYNKLKIAIVLVIIGGLAGLLIYGVNELTYQQIIDNRIETEEAYYKEIFGIDEDTKITIDKQDIDGLVDQMVTITQKDDGSLIGVIYRGTGVNSYGFVTVLVGFLPDGTLANVVISGSDNTPTYVKSVKKNNLDIFEDQDRSMFAMDAEIDEVTSASYTFGSVVSIVKQAVVEFDESWGDLNE